MSPQTTIAHYRIICKLGEGGMGAVYRATDTKLNRDVAIKVLPDAVADDPDRMLRFTREAQVLASLNHPNIAAIYGVEERAIVMELVGGATPAGPIAVEQTILLIQQLIDALEYAHDKGVVHRDLKPANLKITPEGRLKVLDFGLAKALATDSAATPDPASSPTLTMRATMAGVIMGTAAYMSPEQARGQNVDRRADIWSFGVVLYEMLTGKPLFDAPTVSDILALVLTRDPDLTSIPTRFHRLLRLCLTRDPRQRLSHISAARILLDEPAPAPVPPPSPARRRAILPWTVAALSLGAAAVSLTRFQAAASLPVVRFQLPVLEKAVQPTFELSPDGRFVAVAAATDGPRHLAIRALDSTELRDVPGTEDARYPAWSPGSSSLVFFSQGKLKKIVATGGAAQPLCDAADGRGASWSFDGTIVFAPSDTGPLFRVPSSGGTPVAVTKTPSTGPRETDRYPSFLPNSDRFLFLHVTGKPENSGVYLGSLGGAPPIRILPDQTSAYYVPDASAGKGWIVFHRETSVMAQPLDAGNARVSGEAVQLATLVGGMANTNRWAFSASANGVLAFWQNAGGARQQLVWVDRSGGRLGDVINTSPVLDFEVSPDGKRLVVRVGGARSDFWLQDLERSSRSRFTFNEHADGRAVWSPDGRTIAYTERPAATLSRIYRKPADSSAKEEVLLESDHQLYVNDWSTDGRYLSYHVQSQDRQQDLLLLPTSSSSRGPIPYQNSPAGESRGAFSPDSHWMAYTSNESSEPRVYVQAIPPSGPKWQVSTAGGDRAAWRRDGRELYYIASDRKLMAVPVEAGPAGFHAGIPKPLFEVAGFSQYQPAPDGQRFLVQLPPEGEPSVPPLDMILNWPQVVHRP